MWIPIILYIHPLKLSTPINSLHHANVEEEKEGKRRGGREKHRVKKKKTRTSIDRLSTLHLCCASQGFLSLLAFPCAVVVSYLRSFSSLCLFLLSSSSLIIRITSCRLFSTLASSSSLWRRRASRPANHSSRARSSSSGFACATIQAFIASRCCRHTHVAVTVRLTAHSAKAVWKKHQKSVGIVQSKD